MKVDHIYVAAGCSPEIEVLDVSPNGMLVYSSGPNVFITDLRTPNVIPVAEFPTGHVHCVRILSDADGKARWVVAGSADRTLRIWDVLGTPVSLLQLEETINALDAIRSNDFEWTICASDTNGTVTVVVFDGAGMKPVSSMFVSSRKVISLGITILDGTPIVFAGLGDSQIAVIVDSCIVLRLTGHSNWVNTINCIHRDELYVATGSSDMSFRIWKVVPTKEKKKGLVELVPINNEFTLPSTGKKYSVECETVLYGHEGMISSVRWDHQNPKLSLITASSDRSLIVWEPGTDGWKSVLQLGELSGMSTASGFLSGAVCRVEGEERIIAHGITGSIIQYVRQGDQFKAIEPVVSGHTLTIPACSWEPTGKFLLTVGVDKTSRIFAPSQAGEWHEIARPQIHGYDMQAVSVLDSEHFLSAGDEKILRAFEAPRSFSLRLKHLGDPNAIIEEEKETAVVVPALGLSNKVGGAEDESVSRPDMPLNLPPSEYDLSRHTLWMETDKLYGHGLEVYSLAVDLTGKMAASASKATTAEDAMVRLWYRNPNNTWTPLRTVIVHTLTVVKMAFSPDGQYLLAVSRDRHFAIIDLRTPPPTCIQYQEAHSRIIWCGDWSSDGQFLVTGSRDRTLKTWRKVDGRFKEDDQCQLKFESPVTAVAIHSIENIMAVGLENGTIFIYKHTDNAWKSEGFYKTHSSSINDLKWRPGIPTEKSEGPEESGRLASTLGAHDCLELASVSNTVQIHKISINV